MPEDGRTRREAVMQRFAFVRVINQWLDTANPRTPDTTYVGCKQALHYSSILLLLLSSLLCFFYCMNPGYHRSLSAGENILHGYSSMILVGILVFCFAFVHRGRATHLSTC